MPEELDLNKDWERSLASRMKRGSRFFSALLLLSCCAVVALLNCLLELQLLELNSLLKLNMFTATLVTSNYILIQIRLCRVNLSFSKNVCMVSISQ